MNGFTRIPGNISGYEKKGIETSVHVHYLSVAGSNNTRMIIERFKNIGGKVIYRSSWILSRWACGNKEDIRDIIRNVEKKHPDKIYKIRGYGGNKPGNPILFEIMEKENFAE